MLAPCLAPLPQPHLSLGADQELTLGAAGCREEMKICLKAPFGSS